MRRGIHDVRRSTPTCVIITDVSVEHMTASPALLASQTSSRNRVTTWLDSGLLLILHKPTSDRVAEIHSCHRELFIDQGTHSRESVFVPT